MPRKRIYNTVRTDALEGKIAHYQALGDYNGADAIRDVARSIGAPIDEAEIAAQVTQRRAVYNGEPLPPREEPVPSSKAPRGRKTGVFDEIRTIRNRADGNTYKWRYEVTWQDGKRVKSRSLGRVEKVG